MHLIVQLSPSLGQELASGRTSSKPAKALLAAVAKRGGTLTPLHPGIDDPEMANQFFVDVPDDSTGKDLQDELLKSNEVTAAYVKPPDALPSP